MRIFLVGGGSGGHFYPLVAIAEAIRSTAQNPVETELYYIGPEPYNRDLLDSLQITYTYCPAGKRRKYFSLFNILDLFKTIAGFVLALKKLYVYYPDVVMSKGSFTSVPIILAAAILRIPIVIHESDTKPGTANKIATMFAKYIAISYGEVAEYFPESKIALTGIPIRKEIITRHEHPHQLLNLDVQRPILFITGGSLGAERINNLILESLDELLPMFTIVHQVGKDNLEMIITTVEQLIPDETLRTNYHPYGHMSATQISAAYDAANIVISRAGSTAIHEIAIKQKPAILIPIPESISHDQRSNAYAYINTGAASVLEEDNLSDGLLVAEITRIMGDPNIQTEMQTAAAAFAKTDAASIIATALIEIGNEHT